MDALTKLGLLADLEQEHCHLNHGPGADPRAHRAANYLVVPVGFRRDDGGEQAARTLVIPVCAECAGALQGEEWTLLFCLECLGSQWIYRPLAKNRYRHHILWLRGCPKCTNRFGGLYFNDLGQRPGHGPAAVAMVHEAAAG